MVKKIYCDVDDNVWVRSRFSEDDGRISVVMAVGDDFSLALLTPADARKLRKQIKRALEAIEGVEDDIKEDTQGESDNDNGLKFYVGDKVRIAGNTLRGIGFGHHFEIGSIVEITEVAPGTKQPYRSGNGSGWLAAEDIEPA